MPASDVEKFCEYCQQNKKARGFTTHQKSCKAKLEAQKLTMRYLERKNRDMVTDSITRLENTIYPTQETMDTAESSFFGPHEPQDESRNPVNDLERADIATSAVDSNATSSPSDTSSTPQIDDIKSEYHPYSGRATTVHHFDEYGVYADEKREANNKQPWKPFQSCTDFEVAELALECAMNAKQTGKLLELMNRVAQGLDKFTLSNTKDLYDLWDYAAERATKFVKTSITVPYREVEREFEVFARPLWDWATELLTDPEIVSKMQWDATRLFKFNGSQWELFITEPWTADRWWKLQTCCIPKDGKPLVFLFYADKSKLSSFGTAKGYPVIVRCLNLPEEIRNGLGLGGGHVVGWIPIVAEDPQHSHKKDFVDFKAVVWHRSVFKVFESIIEYSQTGCLFKCGDAIRRLLYPLVMIGSADYEEQCMICLICGLMGLCPCPKCLVPRDMLSDLSISSPLRTPEHTLQLFTRAAAMSTLAEKEAMMKEYSIRPVENVFMKLANSDPYSAVSFDILHFLFSGLWGDHLFPQLKKHLSKIGCHAETRLDKRFDAVMPWRGLHHFKSVTTISFNDGSHHRDISKIFLYTAHGTIKCNNKAAYQMMVCVRHYLNLYMYASLDVHTETTMSLGREAVRSFHSALQNYIQLQHDPDLDKSWDFIKLHYLKHLFDDIQEKGTQRGFNTMPNEKLHGPLRKIYLLMTNFKDFGNQITKIEHRCLVAGLIRGQLDILAERDNEDIDCEDQAEEGYEIANCTRPANLKTLCVDDQRVLGSKLPPLSFATLESSKSVAFSRFRLRLAEFMSHLLPASGIALPGAQRVKLTPDDEITPYQFLKVNYESKETWRTVTDFLRCNPSFHKRARYDFILFATDAGPVFAQLLYLFKCSIMDGGCRTEYPIAFIQAYKVVRQRTRDDRQWGLLRLRRESTTEFIPMRSIIRGALVVNASDSEVASDVHVVDVLDADMFLRVKEAFPGYTEAAAT